MATCRACHHPQRDRVDRELAAGTALRAIASWSSLSTGGLMRHKVHVRETIKAAQQAESVTRGSDLLARIESVISDAKGIAEVARARSNLATANSALNTVIRSLELVGRLTGELQTPGLGGIHFRSSKTLNINVGTNDDSEIAMLVGEATNGFEWAEFQRLKRLARAQEKPALCVPSTGPEPPSDENTGISDISPKPSSPDGVIDP